MIPYYDFAELRIGGVTLYAFGLLVAVGVILGHFVAVDRARRVGLGPPKTADLFALWVLGTGLVAGHVLDLVLYRPAVLLARPVELFMLHRGLSSFGGIAGAVGAGLVYIHRRGLDPWRWADLCTYAFPFGWFFGRMGCAFAHDHPGRRTTSFLAVRFPPEHILGGPRYDLGLLELALTPLLMAVVLLTARRARRPGTISGALAVSYALLRFPLDFLRATDLGDESDVRYAGLTPAQWCCFLLLALGVWILARPREDRALSPEPAR